MITYYIVNYFVGQNGLIYVNQCWPNSVTWHGITVTQKAYVIVGTCIVTICKRQSVTVLESHVWDYPIYVQPTIDSVTYAGNIFLLKWFVDQGWSRLGSIYILYMTTILMPNLIEFDTGCQDFNHSSSLVFKLFERCEIWIWRKFNRMSFNKAIFMVSQCFLKWCLGAKHWQAIICINSNYVFM